MPPKAKGNGAGSLREPLIGQQSAPAAPQSTPPARGNEMQNVKKLQKQVQKKKYRKANEKKKAGARRGFYCTAPGC